MVSYIAHFLASFLDPVRFIVTLVIMVLFVYKKGIVISVLVSAIVSFVVMESLLMQSQGLRIFGEGVLWGLPASLVHGVLSYNLVKYFKKLEYFTSTNFIYVKLLNNEMSIGIIDE